MHTLWIAESVGNLCRMRWPDLLRLMRRHVPQASQAQEPHTQGELQMSVLLSIIVTNVFIIVLFRLRSKALHPYRPRQVLQELLHRLHHLDAANVVCWHRFWAARNRYDTARFHKLKTKKKIDRKPIRINKTNFVLDQALGVHRCS